MKKVMLMLGCVMFMTMLAGCGDTWKGIGKDVENAGEEMQK